MHKITFKIEGGGDVIISAADGENLLSLAQKGNVAIDAPCSGNGACGKCRVKLVEGGVGFSGSRHITDDDAAEGWRLACESRATADAGLLVPDIASAYLSRLRVEVFSPPLKAEALMQPELFGFARGGKVRDASESGAGAVSRLGTPSDSGIRVEQITLAPPSLDDTVPDNERLCREAARAFGVAEAQLPYAVLKTLPDILRDNDFSVCCVTAVDGNSAVILSISPQDCKPQALGLAIDIGTTTVACLLVDLATGDVLAKADAGNAQIRYGADVINRIVEQQKKGGVKRLQKAIVEETLLPMIDAVCKAAGVAREWVYRVEVASNTTMNHLLLGINADYLRREPYIPTFFEIEPFDPALIGIPLAPTAKMSLAPNVGSYVGGDITAGILSCMMWDRPGYSLLIDLGTNGEIVFGNDEFLMACACSAGPAFEGGGISCGMRAADGAIEACVIEADTMQPQLKIIGAEGQKPIGLCGSGLIDVVAELFKAGFINGKGKFTREGERIRRDEYGIGSFVLAYATETATGRDITVSEIDIDSFIRAKGAIYSAIMTLLKPLGFTTDDLESVMVAGGIGSGINIGNAINVGMLPRLPTDKYSYIGNSSLAGAYAALTSLRAAEQLGDIARNTTYVELSTQPGYMDEFIAASLLAKSGLSGMRACGALLSVCTESNPRSTRGRAPLTPRAGASPRLPLQAAVLPDNLPRGRCPLGTPRSHNHPSLRA
jgi:uncharacterized 2Fe-2S/4Fe-4S cluster protein (DUF4445 family)